jgi:hypothetical protein
MHVHTVDNLKTRYMCGNAMMYWSNLCGKGVCKLDIVSYLHSWKHGWLLQPLSEQKLWHLLNLQDTKGARQFFEGWVHSDWELLQEQYYISIVYHKQINKSQLEDTNALDLQVRELSDDLTITGLRPKDRYLSTIPLARLLSLPRIQKVEWLHQANLALAQSKKWHFRLRRPWHEHHWRHHNMILSMQSLLSNWLHNSSWWQLWLH